jgi:hypothetical protein
MIILPGDPLFDETLATPPPNWWNSKPMETEIALVCDSQSGLMRPASPEELWDYVYGGEYEERLQAIDELY